MTPTAVPERRTRRVQAQVQRPSRTCRDCQKPVVITGLFVVLSTLAVTRAGRVYPCGEGLGDAPAKRLLMQPSRTNCRDAVA